MENIIFLLYLNNPNNYNRTIIKLSNCCKLFHNKFKKYMIEFVKQYLITNEILVNIGKLKVGFIYYISWCNIKDTLFLENIKNKNIDKNIKKRLILELNRGKFKYYKDLQSKIYKYNLIKTLFDYSNDLGEIIKLGYSCKKINIHLKDLSCDYYKIYIETLIININYSNHLLIINYFLIFCEETYAKSIYELKYKSIDYDTRKLLDKYLKKKKLLEYLRYNYGIIL